VAQRDSAETSSPLLGGAGFRFALVVSRFNDRITDALRVSARAALIEAGVEAGDIDELAVPGAFELPQAARAIAARGQVDAVVCLGCVIRGETAHFEYISSAAALGVMQAALDTGVPVAFGVLTTDTLAQAEARAGDDRENKGREAAAAALEMANLFRRLGSHPAAGRTVRRRTIEGRSRTKGGRRR
jgi:6,7-dimethyl-8-ribityllumazine synthase